MGRCLDTPPVNLSKIVPEEIQALVEGHGARVHHPWRSLGTALCCMADHSTCWRSTTCVSGRSSKSCHDHDRAKCRRALSGVGTTEAAMEQVLKDAASHADNVEEVRPNARRSTSTSLRWSEDAPVVKIINLILVRRSGRKLRIFTDLSTDSQTSALPRGWQPHRASSPPRHCSCHRLAYQNRGSGHRGRHTGWAVPHPCLG
jgi:hypothetical protein